MEMECRPNWCACRDASASTMMGNWLPSRIWMETAGWKLGSPVSGVNAMGKTLPQERIAASPYIILAVRFSVIGSVRTSPGPTLRRRHLQRAQGKTSALEKAKDRFGSADFRALPLQPLAN